MAALGTSDQLTLCCRLWASPAAGHPGVGLAEGESTFGALDKVSEFHTHDPFNSRLFIKVTRCQSDAKSEHMNAHDSFDFKKSFLVSHTMNAGTAPPCPPVKITGAN